MPKKRFWSKVGLQTATRGQQNDGGKMSLLPSNDYLDFFRSNMMLCCASLDFLQMPVQRNKIHTSPKLNLAEQPLNFHLSSYF